MSNLKFLSLFAIAAMLTFTSCDDDDDDPQPPPPPPSGEEDLSLNVSNLPALGSDYRYEGWIVVDGFPISIGKFQVNDNGDPSPSDFDANESEVNEASGFRITIEPEPDDNSDPSNTVILAGDFDGNSASLTTDDDDALGTDFDDVEAQGTYYLATPTDGDGTNELSGVWWGLDPLVENTPGLLLPDLPEGWKYEGWAVIDEEYVSTGKFTSVSNSDEQNVDYGGNQPAPEIPGEDFLMNAPEGVTFPTDLSGQSLLISVEPYPDNSTGPFGIQPLTEAIPVDAEPENTYTMDNNADSSIPTGVVTR